MPAINPLMRKRDYHKPNLVVFFVIDRSGSMSVAGRMNSVNHAVRDAIPALRGIGGADADIKIAVLMFSSGAEWMYDELIAIEDFTWSDIEPLGLTDFGSACDELCDKLSRKQFMSSQAGYRQPVIILMSDGEPTDHDVWPEALNRLQANRWFQLSIKLALAVDAADEELLARFVGSRKGVYRIDDTQILKRVTKVVAVKSAEIGSRSMHIDINAAEGDCDEAMKSMVHGAIQDEIDHVIGNDLYASDIDDDDWEY